MPALKVCRICLCKGVKMYSYEHYHLKEYYEEVMAKKISNKDILPHYFCFLCSSMLHKLHKFKDKCYKGEMALKELLWSGTLNLLSISQIDRQNKNLQSPVDLIKVNKRVRTCIVKSKTMFESNNTVEIKRNKITETEMLRRISDVSDNSLDDRNLDEIKSEMIDNPCTSTGSILDEKMIGIECIKEKNIAAFSNIDNNDDRIFSEDDNDVDLNLASDDVAKPSDKEEIINEINIVNEDINLITKTAKNDNEKSTKIVLNINEVKKTKPTTKKARKFERKSVQNILDPKHWLKITLSEEEALANFMKRAQDPKFLKAAFKCNLCYKGFSTQEMITRHELRHHSESLGPIECRFCRARFKKKCFLTNHIVQHYHKYECLRCDFICPLFTTAQFHNEYHNGVVRTCEHCGKEFRHLSTFYTHLRSHRSEHLCTLCGASFVSEVGLKMHKKIKHINIVIDPVEQDNIHCEKCDIKFVTRTAYDEHLHHSAKHSDRLEEFDTEAPPLFKAKRIRKFTRERKPQKSTICTICNKTFHTVTAYTNHHTTEHKDQPLPSMEAERQICEICGISLAAGSVASHVNTHTREILYSCPTCHMQFNSKGSMTRHQLTHTGEKRYKCPLCEKRFTQKCSMKLHYRTFHLKEPYPKRNRRKNPVVQKEIDDYKALDDSDDIILKGYHLNG